MFEPLVFVRAIHFAATISVAGSVFFLAFVGEPAFRVADENGPIPALVRSHLKRIAWVSLAIVVASDVAWLILQAERMSELSLAAVFSEGIVWSVLWETDFGSGWMARLVFIALFAGLLFRFDSTVRIKSWKNVSVLLVGASVVGALAFVGHAAAGSGIEGAIHLAADILHLVGAAAWIGALVPLAIVLHAARGGRDASSIKIAREATLRFSTLGIASVGTLVATGIINTWVLAGSVPALVGTDYGRLLLVKVGLFLVMLSIAAINRLRLTPSLVHDFDASATRNALLQLRNNSLVEASAGAIILFIVGVLGTLPPGIQE